MSNEHGNGHENVPPGATRRSVVCTSIAGLATLAAFALSAYVLYTGETGKGVVCLVVAVGAAWNAWRTMQPRISRKVWLEPKEPMTRADHAMLVSGLLLVGALSIIALVVVFASMLHDAFFKPWPLHPAAAFPIVLAAFGVACAMRWRAYGRMLRRESSGTPSVRHSSSYSAPTSPQSR